LVLRYLASLHSWFRSAIATYDVNVVEPLTVPLRWTWCQKFSRSVIHRHKLGESWQYCAHEQCWESQSSTNGTTEYLCIQGGAPALSYVSIKSIPLHSVSAVLAHHDLASGRPAYLAANQRTRESGKRFKTVMASNKPKVTTFAAADGAGGSNNSEFKSINHEDNDDSNVQINDLLLVFDGARGHTDSHHSWYKWVRAEGITGSDVIVLSYNRGERKWFYEANSCAQCAPIAHIHQSWFDEHGWDGRHNRFRLHGFLDTPESAGT